MGSQPQFVQFRKKKKKRRTAQTTVYFFPRIYPPPPLFKHPGTNIDLRTPEHQPNYQKAHSYKPWAGNPPPPPMATCTHSPTLHTVPAPLHSTPPRLVPPCPIPSVYVSAKLSPAPTRVMTPREQEKKLVSAIRGSLCELRGSRSITSFGAAWI